AAGSLPAGPHRQSAPDWFRHGHRTSWPSKPRGHKKRATSCAPLRPRWSCACGWKRLPPPLPCAAPPRAGSVVPWFLALFAPRFSGGELALPGNCLHPLDVLAHAANLLQALGLSHVQLELQLEELVVQIMLLLAKFFSGQVANFVGFHQFVLK